MLISSSVQKTLRHLRAEVKFFLDLVSYGQYLFTVFFKIRNSWLCRY
jgi:hypothetical protein